MPVPLGHSNISKLVALQLRFETTAVGFGADVCTTSSRRGSATAYVYIRGTAASEAVVRCNVDRRSQATVPNDGSAPNVVHH
jgi:hypothetical protein